MRKMTAARKTEAKTKVHPKRMTRVITTKTAMRAVDRGNMGSQIWHPLYQPMIQYDTMAGRTALMSSTDGLLTGEMCIAARKITWSLHWRKCNSWFVLLVRSILPKTAYCADYISNCPPFTHARIAGKPILGL